MVSQSGDFTDIMVRTLIMMAVFLLVLAVITFFRGRS